MFAPAYFAPRYFASRYWPDVGAQAVAAAAEPQRGGSSKRRRRRGALTLPPYWRGDEERQRIYARLEPAEVEPPGKRRALIEALRADAGLDEALTAAEIAAEFARESEAFKREAAEARERVLEAKAKAEAEIERAEQEALLLLYYEMAA